MKAIVNHSYGTPEVLELSEVDPPAIGDEQMLVRVHAAAVNPLDWHMLTGTPYLMRLTEGLRRPKRVARGVDMAGVVERVGADVTAFRTGDRVFGGARGAFAELVAVAAKDVVAVPEKLSFEEAAALPVAAVTALQGLRDQGGLRAGQSVLINGAAGGVGTYAVQIAKAMGADVTGVCSTGNVELVRSLGADRVIDYTVDDFTADGRRFDIFLDNIGNRSLADCRRVLAPTGVYVIVGAPKKGKLLGPLKRVLAAKVRFVLSRRRAAWFIASETPDELRALVAMTEDGKLRSVIDRRYPLTDTAEAIAYQAQGHARGKVIISVVDPVVDIVEP
ncbi:MAG: NAD(P)-dependent alcohol dehydrogenase [Actinomycetota bacterium]|jgi:NADPH:quinone reductase-like Zn-dependent oxidoreductase|nr:MAG: alcohol dehydrogenase [Acidimicrobiaceae bacterium]